MVNENGGESGPARENKMETEDESANENGENKTETEDESANENNSMSANELATEKKLENQSELASLENQS